MFQNNKKNIILCQDAYKLCSHWKMYPPKTEYLYSYLESRGGEFDETMFFGLQGFIKRYLKGVVLEQWMINEAQNVCDKSIGPNMFNKDGWQYILDEYGGKLPIEINAVPEGSVIPIKNALLTVVNTDKNVPWLTGFIETLLLQGCWYPTTVSTLSFKIKQLIGRFCEETGAALSPFHLNDFGFRGVSSYESAQIGGLAHLVNWLGSDNVGVIPYAKECYNAEDNIFYSVPASEHSCTISWGRENEEKAYEHFMNEFPNGILSIVSDSYSLEYAVSVIFGQNLYNKIVNRNGKIVVRPDSGKPSEVVVQTLKELDNRFTSTTNNYGYKVLPPYIGVIQGDGNDYQSIYSVCQAVKNAGFSLDNVIFGMGGALLQQVNRDTQNFAIKSSAVCIDGQWIDICKTPKTDMNKASKKGRMKLINDGSVYQTVSIDDERSDILRPVFRNGELLIDESLNEIRKRAESWTKL